MLRDISTYATVLRIIANVMFLKEIPEETR